MPIPQAKPMRGGRIERSPRDFESSRLGTSSEKKAAATMMPPPKPRSVFSMVGGIFALLTSVYAADTVFVVLTAISGLAVVIVWASICLAHFNFRRQMIREGKPLDGLAYRAPGHPWVSLAGFALCVGSCIGLAFDESQRIALYCGIPYIFLCYALYPIVAKRAKTRS